MSAMMHGSGFVLPELGLAGAFGRQDRKRSSDIFIDDPLVALDHKQVVATPLPNLFCALLARMQGVHREHCVLSVVVRQYLFGYAAFMQFLAGLVLVEHEAGAVMHQTH